MHFHYPLLAGLLALAPRLSPAQPTEPAPGPRYYLGLAAYSSAYQPLGGGAYRSPRVPVQVVAGYQLRPRLAVQLGVACSSIDVSYFGISRYYPYQGPPSGVYFDYDFQGHERNTSLALLARYTLTRRLGHRLQVDALGGLTAEISRYSSLRVTSDSSQVPVTNRYESLGTDWGVLLTAGPSIRYRLGRHLEALLDFTLNFNLRRDNLPESSVLTGATALGLRYRFGRR